MILSLYALSSCLLCYKVMPRYKAWYDNATALTSRSKMLSTMRLDKSAPTSEKMVKNNKATSIALSSDSLSMNIDNDDVLAAWILTRLLPIGLFPTAQMLFNAGFVVVLVGHLYDLTKCFTNNKPI